MKNVKNSKVYQISFIDIKFPLCLSYLANFGPEARCVGAVSCDEEMGFVYELLLQ